MRLESLKRLVEKTRDHRGGKWRILRELGRPMGGKRKDGQF